MDYQKIYNQLIERAKNRKLDGYREKHHVLPRCVGGADDRNNIVKLTAREHFICHRLLCKIYPHEQKLIYASWMMVTNKDRFGRDYKVNSRTYSILKEQVAKVTSERYKGRISPTKGMKKTTDQRKKISDAQRGKSHSSERKWKISEGLNGHEVSKETREKLRLKMAGKTHSEETKNKLRGKIPVNKGKRHRSEDIQKIKDALANKPILKCPHCDMKSRSYANMKRYHFDNCKHK